MAGMPGRTALRAVEVEQNQEPVNVNVQRRRGLVPIAWAHQAKEQDVIT